jgi:flagellar motility protein MotE (MotC chaperone)
MLKFKKIVLPAAFFFIFLSLAAPVGPAYSMSQIKSWVNKVRPGTFPELEAAKEKKTEGAEVRPKRQEALTDTEKQILLSLNERKRQLDQRDLLLNQREEQLRALRDNIQHQVTELKRLQEEIEASMEAKKAQDAENLKKVVSLYNGMDPKKSAAKFQTLDPKVAVQILLAMNQRKAAALLEELPPDVAKRLTEEIVRKVPAQN